MNIRRQYSLPNCTLTLEGISDAAPGQMEVRPLMTMLLHAECRFQGIEEVLSGGRDFFESLATTVSFYAQEFLSGVYHPQERKDKPNLVHLQKIREKNVHRLTVADVEKPEALTKLDLNTVQLFDLVEAVDQFFADSSTLPDLTLQLAPVSRRYLKSDEPLAKRAAPVALGTTSLALAAIALFFVPIPEVRKPDPVTPPQPNASNPSPSPTDSPTTSPTSDLESVLASVPEITDPTKLRFLQRSLYNKLDQAWQNRDERFAENLVYRVGVGQDGEIVGYKPVNELAGDRAQDTPLPELLYIPTNGSGPGSEPIAQYRVVFTRGGILQVSPWRGFSGSPTLGEEITDSETVKELQDKLYSQIREDWEGTPTFTKNLVYRVAVNKEGAIADYEADNQPAFDYVAQTPLQKLSKPPTDTNNPKKVVIPEEPLAQFKVVFKPSGVLEVSPLKGNN